MWRVAAAVLSAMCLVSGDSWAAQEVQQVLPPSANDGFTSLRDGIEVGAAGKQIKDADVDIRREHVVLHLKLDNDEKADLMLTRKTKETRGPSSRYFAIQPGTTAAGLDLKPIEKLLDVAFPSNPWVDAPTTAPENAAAPVAPH